MDILRSYKGSSNLSMKINSFYNTSVGSSFDHFHENEILNLTRALLIVCCGFSSAWNSRKLVLSMKHTLSLFMDELQLSMVILSYSPKSEYAWSHRRWVIKVIAEKFQNLQEVVKKESELVKEIAEKSKMNYRAWNHRCWLILYMTELQVRDELDTSRKWAELHVADNSCFHYRGQLMLKLLENDFLGKYDKASFNKRSDVHHLWKEEIRWNYLLIQRYPGREALWLHRRFLSLCWINHFALDREGPIPGSEEHHDINPTLDVFINEELQLVDTCLKTPADEFEDIKLQSQHAASYILWISKRIPQLESKFQDKLRVLKATLIKRCPEKSLLWESLLE